MIALLALLACPHPTATTPVPTQLEGPLLTVATPTISRDRDGLCVFDQGRHVVVSAHQALSETPLIAELGTWATGVGMADDIVLDWFGEAPPERLELVLGRDLPLDLAAQLVHLAAQHSPLPVVVSVAEEDAEACSRSRAYLGSLLPTDNAPWSTAELEQLAGLAGDAERFWARIPASGR